MNSYVDEMLGRLMDALDRSEIADTTLLIASSDHGDFAGDYGLVEKIHNAYYDVTARVPLLFRGPRVKAGHVVDEPVELMDLCATFSELAGVSLAHTHFSRSLVPQLEGQPGDPNRAVFAECGYNLTEPHCFEGSDSACPTLKPENLYYPQTRQHQEKPETMDRTVMIRTQREKLIYRPRGVSEYYDLIDDPRELVNAIDEEQYASSVGRLKNRLLEWYVTTSDVVPPTRDPRNFPGYS